MTPIIHAFRAATRSFRRRPGFFAIATLSLGLSLGLSTAVFAMIDALRHPLVANREIDRLYRAWIVGAGAGRARPSQDEITERIASMPSVERTAAYLLRGSYVMGGDLTARRTVHLVGPDYFDVIGVVPARGRAFAADDYERGTTAVVSDLVWRAHFDNRADLAGATITIGDRTHDVIGVLPPHAQAGEVVLPTTDGAIASVRPGYNLAVRLRHGRTEAQAAVEGAAVTAQFVTQYGRGDPPFSFRMTSARPDPLGLSTYHFAMIAAALGIVIIACANVSALMLARGVAARRNHALQLALGAKPIHLSLQVIAEVAVLGAAGALVGILIAVWTTRLFVVGVPENLNFVGLPTPHWSLRVFATLLAATGTAVALSAAVPAWIASRTDPNEPLKDNAGTTTGRAGLRFRVLVVGEIALSMTLVFGASLIAKYVREISSADLGFHPTTLVRASVVFPYARDTSGLGARWEQTAVSLLAKIRATPGVVSASAIAAGHVDGTAVVSDRTSAGGPALAMGNRGYTIAGTGYFATYGVPIVSGRDFLESDRAAGAVILSEAAARALFPAEPAVGRVIKLGDSDSNQPWLQIVGVARDIVRSFDEYEEGDGFDPRIAIYASVPTESPWALYTIARASSNAAVVSVELRRALLDLAPPGSIVDAAPWIARYMAQLRATQYIGRLFTLLGVASLALAVAGLFGVLSYIVSQRMREFAVRLALGARRVDVLGLVMRDGAVMALAGTAIGAAIGLRAGFALWDVIGFVYPVDAEALVIAEVALLAASLAACVVPGFRATRANPVEVMRAT
jgi:putative ABC transport system permease protein